MRKAVVFLAALVIFLTFSSFAFGDVYFGIWTRSLLRLAEASDTNTTAVQSWELWGGLDGPFMAMSIHFDNDKVGYRQKFTYRGKLGQSASVTLPAGPIPAGTYGVSLSGGFGMEYVYGILKVIPDMLDVNLGYFHYDEFRKDTGVDDRELSIGDMGRFEGWGLQAIVAPKDSGFVGSFMWGAQLGQMTIADNLYYINAAASYTLPDMLKFTIGSTYGNSQGATPADLTRNIFARIELLMVPDLTLWILGVYSGLEEAKLNSDIELLLGAGFTADAFNVKLGADLKISAPKAGGDSTTTYEIQLCPSYDLGPAKILLVGGFKGSSTAGADPTIYIEPWVHFNDFGARIGFSYEATGATYKWYIPLRVDWSF